MMLDTDERLPDEDTEQSGLEESDNGSASYSGQNLYRRRKRRKEAERRKRKKEQETAKKIATIAKRAVRSTTGSVAASVCGIMLLVVFCAIIMVASVAASPLGILFSNDAVSPGSIPLNAAIAQIQAEYTEWLGACRLADMTAWSLLGSRLTGGRLSPYLSAGQQAQKMAWRSRRWIRRVWISCGQYSGP